MTPARIRRRWPAAAAVEALLDAGAVEEDVRVALDALTRQELVAVLALLVSSRERGGR